MRNVVKLTNTSTETQAHLKPTCADVQPSRSINQTLIVLPKLPQANSVPCLEQEEPIGEGKFRDDVFIDDGVDDGDTESSALDHQAHQDGRNIMSPQQQQQH